MTMTDEELIALLRDCSSDEAMWSRQAADRIEALVDEVARLTKERDSAVKGQDDWRNDYKALSSAIVGDSGLSAMLVATQARLFKPRAEAAEQLVATLAAKVSACKAEIVTLKEREAMRLSALETMLTIPDSEAAQGILKAYARAALAEIKGLK